jgi:hypothetical protein
MAAPVPADRLGVAAAPKQCGRRCRHPEGDLMAECPSCNAPLKDGDWTCGACGAPVAGAGMAAAPGAGPYAGETTAYTAPGAPAYGAPPASGSPGAWGPEHQPRPAAVAAPASTGSSGLLKLVLVVGAVAVLAVVLVWFFALRGPSTTGEEFLGSWTAATQQGIATITVSRDGDAFAVAITGNDTSQKVTVPAHLDGTDLIITMDDFSQMAGEGNAEAFKTTLKALAGDFEMIFSSVDATHLDLRIVGTAASGQDFDETIPLTKDAVGTT